MLETIGTILGVAVIAIVIWSVLWLIGRAMFGAGDNRHTKAEAYEARIANAQLARTAALQDLAWQIKATPENQRAALWDLYLQLESQDKSETYTERQTLVSMQTVIDDRTQAELDAGINPYKTEKQTSDMPVNIKRARLGWK
jgi:hypothetical protein